MKIAIVLLYGAYDNEREDIDAYRAYLQKISGEISREKFEKVILCGGKTNSNNDISEAESVREYLDDINNFQDYILEENSITTRQNLEYAHQFLDELGADEVTVYCDNVRKAKVIWLASHFVLNDGPAVIAESLSNYRRSALRDYKNEKLTVRSFEFSVSKTLLEDQIYSSLVEVLGVYDSNVEEVQKRIRKQLFGLS